MTFFWPRDQNFKSNCQKQDTFHAVSILVVEGDITRERTEVIVNAANGLLVHGAGVSS